MYAQRKPKRVTTSDIVSPCSRVSARPAAWLKPDLGVGVQRLRDTPCKGGVGCIHSAAFKAHRRRQVRQHGPSNGRKNSVSASNSSLHACVPKYRQNRTESSIGGVLCRKKIISVVCVEAPNESRSLTGNGGRTGRLGMTSMSAGKKKRTTHCLRRPTRLRKTVHDFSRESTPAKRRMRRSWPACMRRNAVITRTSASVRKQAAASVVVSSSACFASSAV